MSKPRVLIDGTAFEGRGRIGIWRLFYEVMSRTSREVDYTLLTAQAPVMPVPMGITVSRFTRPPVPVTRRHIIWKISRRFLQSIMRRKFSDYMWHPTFFSTDPRGPRTDTSPARIVTVYDMVSEEFYSIGNFARQQELKRACLKESDYVIAISHATESAVIRFFPEFSGRTRVIQLAADHSNVLGKTQGAEQVSLIDSVPEHYCLFVGGRNLYKHFEFVVRAMASDKWPPELKLFVVGPPPDPAELHFVESRRVRQLITFVESVSDQQLAELYRRARCFLFPSLGEGFGLPVLESQRCGTIPILSDIPVFREVGGDGALYYSSHSTEDLIKTVRLLENRAQRNALRERATANAKRFSWDKAAAETLELYEQAWAE